MRLFNSNHHNNNRDSKHAAGDNKITDTKNKHADSGSSKHADNSSKHINNNLKHSDRHHNVNKHNININRFTINRHNVNRYTVNRYNVNRYTINRYTINRCNINNKQDENNIKDVCSTKVITLNTCLAWGGVFLWMVLIFYFSHQPATKSSELSQGVLAAVLGFVQGISPNLARHLEMLQLNYLIRKNAHFIAYLVLAVLTMNALAQNQVRGKRQVLYAFLICLLYAITDEVHQLFIPGRSGEVKDVLLDGIGAATGILLYRLPAVFRQLKST